MEVDDSEIKKLDKTIKLVFETGEIRATHKNFMYTIIQLWKQFEKEEYKSWSANLTCNVQSLCFRGWFSYFFSIDIS